MSVLERLLHSENSGRSAERIGRFELTPMRRRDLRRGVLAIEQLSYPRPWSQGVFESELSQVRSGARRYLVARPCDSRSGGQREIAGYAGLWFNTDEAHVTNVAVHPQRQRAGVATALLLGLADAAIGRDCAAWTLEVRASSVGAQELYRRFGFNPAGVRARYYENSEDAIVMWCTDIQGADYRALLDSIRASARTGPAS